MAKKIVWTKKAKTELFEILEYWINRNKSKVFSIKLNTLINEHLSLLAEFPNLGRKSDINNVYVTIIHKYLLYYETRDNILYILTIRHGRRNPLSLKIK